MSTIEGDKGSIGPDAEVGVAAPPADPPTEKKTAQATSYVVLEKQKDTLPPSPTPKPEVLMVVGTYEARSGTQAVSAHLKDKELDGGTFYAVPARSWQPITVATETKTHLKFS